MCEMFSCLPKKEFIKYGFKKFRAALALTVLVSMVSTALTPAIISQAAAVSQGAKAADIAIGEVNKSYGDKYVVEGNKGKGLQWCVYFAQWCARQAGANTSVWTTTGSTPL